MKRGWRICDLFGSLSKGNQKTLRVAQFHLMLKRVDGMLPHLIGSDIDLTIVRAVADLARAEEWDDIVSTMLPGLQDKNSLASVSNKLATLSPYLAMIGLAGVVAVAAVAAKHRKKKSPQQLP